ncbi:unnamed protein product [Victoria cruziana]
MAFVQRRWKRKPACRRLRSCEGGSRTALVREPPGGTCSRRRKRRCVLWWPSCGEIGGREIMRSRRKMRMTMDTPCAAAEDRLSGVHRFGRWESSRQHRQNSGGRIWLRSVLCKMEFHRV